MSEPATIALEPLDLVLARAWTLSRGTSTSKRNAVLSVTAEGVTGLGEGAPNARYGQSFGGAAAVFARLRDACRTLSPREHATWIERAEEIAGSESELTAALDAALWDWRGKREAVSVASRVATVGASMPETSFSIGIDAPEEMAARAREAAAFAVLKLKVGLGDDEAHVAAVRAATDARLRVDANEGWPSREVALDRIRWLAEKGVELVEQPLPAGDRDGQRWLFERSPLPLVADESCLLESDLEGLVGLFHGVNVKLSKCGGLTRALALVRRARALGFRSMLGCMIESSLGIAAGVAIAPRFDWVDLDGCLLLAADPFAGLEHAGGRWRIPTAPGLGVARR